MRPQLKSAEEWIDELDKTNPHSEGAFQLFDEGIRLIQLNAYKAGMTEAAEIDKVKHESFEITKLRRAILNARDKKETL